jgi:hypothetical protein
MKTAPIALLAVFVLLLTGCSADKQAVTVGNAAKTTQTAAPVEQASHRLLTSDQIAKVLPTAVQAGASWVVTPAGADPTSTPGNTTFTPAGCSFSADVNGMSGSSILGSGTAASAEGKLTYKPSSSSSTIDVHQAAVDILSYKDVVNTSVIDRVAEKLKSCAKFTSTDNSSGITASWEVQPLSLPNYGDKTLAFRLQGGVGMFTFVVDFVTIAVGHNVIIVVQAGLGGITPEVTSNLASSTVANLNNVK